MYCGAHWLASEIEIDQTFNPYQRCSGSAFLFTALAQYPGVHLWREKSAEHLNKGVFLIFSHFVGIFRIFQFNFLYAQIFCRRFALLLALCASNKITSLNSFLVFL